MSNNIVQFNEEIIKGQIKELVRGSVEEALIEMYLAGVSIFSFWLALVIFT